MLLAGGSGISRGDELPAFITKFPEISWEQDAKWVKAMVGTWRFQRKSGEGSYDGRTTYTADGKFDARVIFTGKEKRAMIVMRGVWNIDQGFLNCKVMRSTSPEIPLGAPTADRILQLDDKVFRYINESSVKITELRVQ